MTVVIKPSSHLPHPTWLLRAEHGTARRGAGPRAVCSLRLRGGQRSGAPPASAAVDS